jgi:antitoxin component of RelBE/YafQ-DinJ toxin-antitoxin module
MISKRFRARSVNIDDETWARCETVARELGTSCSGAIRILITHFFNDHEEIRKRQDQLRSKALEPQI